MSDSQRWMIIFATVAVAVLVWLLAPILTPFLFSALLAYLGDPLVDLLEEHKFSRTAAVITVFSVIFLLLLLIPLVLLPLIEQQIRVLVEKLPVYIDWLQHQFLGGVGSVVGLEGQTLDLAALQKAAAAQLREAGNVVAGILASAGKSGLALLGLVANIVLVPVLTFYLLRDWDIMVQHIREMFPRRLEPHLVRLAGQSDEMLGAFLRGQLTVMFALGIVYSLGLWIIGLDFALLIGLISGLVSFVPYLGFIVGIVLAGIAAYVQFQEFLPLLWVALVFGVGQTLEGMLLTPLLVGDKIGLHPVAVIFAVLAGGQLFGFVGILLALPVAAVVMVLLRFAHEQYLQSHLYQKTD